MKKRLDHILVERGYFASREKAQRAIMAGLVFVEGKCADKPGTKYEDTAEIKIETGDRAFVSRGGVKLEKALNSFPVSAAGKTAIDVGASTGGFTDCLLRHGAAKVYAIDVGYGQLDWTLRNDPRVVVMEKTNARYLNREIIQERVDLAVIDVSFISLTKILPAVTLVLHPRADIIALVKPQFEAGKGMTDKGVIKAPAVHEHVLNQVIAAVRESGWFLHGLDFSPVLGPEGNREFLAWWRRDEGEVDEGIVGDVVRRAHECLK